MNNNEEIKKIVDFNDFFREFVKKDVIIKDISLMNDDDLNTFMQSLYSITSSMEILVNNISYKEDKKE